MTPVERLRPRDALALIALTPPQFVQLAKLRAAHPGGTGDVQPQFWAGAMDGDRLVAAVGWVQEKPDMRMVVEVDKTDDHWGKIGTIALIRKLIESSKTHGIRVQAMILPSNERLKAALTKEGAKCVVEVWEVTNECP